MNYPMRLFEKINTLVKFNVVVCYTEIFELVFIIKWRPPNLSELTPMIFNMVLVHLGL